MRLAKPRMFTPKGNDLRSISDFNSDWADRVARLILVGLVADILNVFISNRIWHGGLTVFANVLIWFGVWGEIRFAKRARTADDNRVAEAERALATAIERGAKLEKEAAEARERTAEIERVTEWRKISPEQHQQIVAAIQDKLSPESEVLIEWERGDPEAYMYAWQISNILEEVRGVKNRGTPNSWINWQGFGVWMNADKAIDLTSIVAAFVNAGIVINAQDRETVKRLSWGPPWGNPAIALYIFVAPKLPPDFEKFANGPNDNDANSTAQIEE
ncbi:MAG: hypothetical protein ACREE4_15180 [Stellaceae bacterium]